MHLIRWLFRRLDRRASPIGDLPNVERLGLHINEATARGVVADPRFAIRIR